MKFTREGDFYSEQHLAEVKKLSPRLGFASYEDTWQCTDVVSSSNERSAKGAHKGDQGLC